MITRHLIALALERLGTEARSKLTESESIVAELARLNGGVVSDPETLANAASRTFDGIAVLTEKQSIVETIGKTNEQLFYVRTLECRRLDDVQHELAAFCELLLGDDREATISEIKAYHDRRLAIVPELIELSQR